MRIAIVTQQMDNIKSGVGTYAQALINGLRDRGHQVEVVTRDGGASRSLKRLDPTPNQWVSAAWTFNRKLRELDRGDRSIDVIHFTDAREASFACYAELQAPLLGTQHDFYSAIAFRNPLKYKKLFPFDWIRRYLYHHATKQVESRALQRLDLIITDSGATGEWMAGTYGIPRERLRVIYNGQNGIQLGNDMKSFPARKNDILFIGGNYQRKNLFLVMRALQAIKEAVPDVRLIVAGKDPTQRRFEKRAKCMGIYDNCLFLGWQPHERVLELYRDAKVYAMPSLYESFANAYLEAMACGIPIVGGVIGGTGELITEGQEGFLEEHDDAEKISRDLCTLLLDGETWERMSSAAISRVRSFSNDRMVEETVAVYQETIEAKRPGNIWNHPA